MKAVVLKSPRNLEILDVPMPKMFEEDQIVIQVGACGICGSDIRYYYGENPWALHTIGNNVPNVPNIILGHEFAGTVVDINSKKYTHLLNKRVVVQPWKACGECQYCGSGRENLCIKTRHLGHGQGWPEMEYFPGALAEYCLAWGDYVFEIPSDISFEKGAMSDILGVAIHTVNRSKIISGSDVICLGGGPAGIFCALVALIKGAHNAFLIEKSPLARNIINQYDNCFPIDPDNEVSINFLRNKILEVGCSAIYDSIGANDIMQRFVKFLSPSGYYVNMATQDTNIVLPKSSMSAERVFTSSSNANYHEIAESVDLIVSNRIPVEKIITHHCTFANFIETFALLLREPKEAFKVVLNIMK